MGRFWLGICLLAVFLALGLWVGKAADSSHTLIAQNLEQAAEKTLAGDLTAGKALAEKAAQQWEKTGTKPPPWQTMRLWTRSTVCSPN